MKKIIIIPIIIAFALIPITTFAKNVDLNFKDISGAWYSDNPDECIDPEEEGSIGTYDGIPTAGLSSLQAEFVDKYHDIAAKLGQQYKIPWETVVAQGILESASGTSNFARTRNNFFGIGAFDSNPNNAKRYSSVEAGWRGYFENIKKTPTYRNHGVFSGNTTTDPYAYLKAIKAAGYATDPNYVTKVGSIIKAIENRSKKKGWQASSVLNTGGSNNIATTTSSTSSSNVRSGVSSSTSSINKTALELAYPTMGNDWKKPKAEYKKALQSLGVWMKGWDQASNYGASCDVFVSTVVRYSGVDKNFKYSHPCKQGTYMANSDKFEEVAQSGYQAKPGDIQVRCDSWNNPAKSTIRHSRIVVQNTDGDLALAHASHGKPRTGEVQKNYDGKVDKYYRIFRVKSDNANDPECDPTANINGDSNILNQTAIKLSWPDYKNRKYNQPTEAYIEAFKATGLYNSYKNSKKTPLRYGSSCSVYISTIVRSAGIAKDFAKGPGTQIQYMLNHPEQWEEVTKGYDKSKAQPGDIQCYSQKDPGNGHSRMVVKTSDGKLHIAEAHLSVGGGMPGQIHSDKEYDGRIDDVGSKSITKTFRVFRLKQNTSTANNNSSNSSIGATALKLAWHTNKRTMKPTEEYKKALEQTGIGKHSDTCGRAGASCDKFVGITVRYSGVDKKFGYWVGDRSKTDERYITTHMKKHPEQWQEVTSGYNKNNAQDGDILVCDGHGCSGHVLILAKLNGKLMQVEGSYCKGNTSCCTVGRVTHEFHKLSNGYHAWRAKNNNTNITSSSTVDYCACQVNGEENEYGISANNGNINKTATALAWPNYRQHAITNPRPAYKRALAAVGLNHYGEKWVNIGASCDAFVATVMRYSGADKNFPCCGVSSQRNYLLSHPEKYQRIPNKGNTSNLQPGDIRVTSGHIEMVVKRADGSFGIAAASHADRTADTNNFYSNPSALIFRRK